MQELLRPYRARYYTLSMRHFHEKLREESPDKIGLYGGAECIIAKKATCTGAMLFQSPSKRMLLQGPNRFF